MVEQGIIVKKGVGNWRYRRKRSLNVTFVESHVIDLS